THQARAGGVRHPVQVRGRQTGLGQGLPDQAQQLAHVVAAGQLRHHAAVFGMQRDLAVDRLRKQAGTGGGVVDGHAGFVAGGFDAKDTHGTGLPKRGTRRIRLRITQGLADRPGRWLSYAAHLARPGILCPGDSMPSVKVRENEPFEFALRRFKRTCEKASVLAETRKREYYEKPTQERKRKAAAAVKRQLRRMSRDVTKRQRLY